LETQSDSLGRLFFIPKDVIEDQVEATYEDGMLKTLLSRREKKVLKFSIAIK
jgi:HSP20 family protein